MRRLLDLMFPTVGLLSSCAFADSLCTGGNSIYADILRRRRASELERDLEGSQSEELATMISILRSDKAVVRTPHCETWQEKTWYPYFAGA